MGEIYLIISIINFFPDEYPGYVTCKLVDTYEKKLVFKDVKIQYVSSIDYFNNENELPAQGDEIEYEI